MQGGAVLDLSNLPAPSFIQSINPTAPPMEARVKQTLCVAADGALYLVTSAPDYGFEEIEAIVGIGTIPLADFSAGLDAAKEHDSVVFFKGGNLNAPLLPWWKTQAGPGIK